MHLFTLQVSIPITNSIKSFSTASDSEMLTNVSKSYGMIFDITTHRNISSVLVVGMEFFVSSTENVDYEVWTMSGSWREINTNETSFHSGFKRIANGTFIGRGVCDDCGFTSIPMDEFENVFVDGIKVVQSFWVALSSDSFVFKNIDLAKSSCDSFTMDSGAAVLVNAMESTNPTSDLSDGKGFLGVIHYQSKSRDVVGTDYPTSSPTVSLNSTVRIASHCMGFLKEKCYLTRI